MKAWDKLYTGDFNYMSQVTLPNGDRQITLSKDGEDKVYHLRVRDLYGENEQVIEDREENTRPSQHIERRMREAKEHGAADQHQPS